MNNAFSQFNKILALLRSNDFQGDDTDIDELIALAKPLSELTPVDIVIDQQGIRVESAESVIPVSIKDYRETGQLNINDPVFTDKQGRSYIERGTVLEFNESYITHDRLVRFWNDDGLSNPNLLGADQENKAVVEASKKMRFAADVDLAIAKDMLAWANSGLNVREAIYYAIKVRDALAATPVATIEVNQDQHEWLAVDDSLKNRANLSSDDVKKLIAKSLAFNCVKIVDDTFALMGRDDVYLDVESKNEFHVQHNSDESSVDIEFYYCTNNMPLNDDEVVVRFESRVWLDALLITCDAGLYYTDSTYFGTPASSELREEVNSISKNLMKSLQGFLSGYDLTFQIGEVHDVPGSTFLAFCKNPGVTENQDNQVEVKEDTFTGELLYYPCGCDMGTDLSDDYGMEP